MRILVLGAGGPAGVNFMKSLMLVHPKIEIYGCDMNKYHLYFAKPYCEKVFDISKKSVEEINNIVKENKIDFVHPQPDKEVQWLSENRRDIDSTIFLPKEEVIDICQDKFLSAMKWFHAGLCEKPLQIDIRATLTKQEIKNAIDKYGKVWLRATEGAGGRGSTPIENVEAGYSWIRYWRAKDWRLNYSWDQWEWMAQPYLPGRNLAWHSLWKDGELIVSQARERLEYIYPYLAPSGVTGTPVVQRTVNEEKINFIAEKSVLTIDPKPNGIYCVDLKEDKDGKPIPTEINAGRFFTTSFFFANAGMLYNIPRANLPYMYLMMGMNLDYPKGDKYNILPSDLYWIRHIDCPAQMVANI